MKPMLLFFLLTSCISGRAQTGQEGFVVPGIPQKLSWQASPVSWKYEQGQLTILAGEKTDLFVDPQHAYDVVNSPKAVFSPADTFLLSAKANVHFVSDYDAAVLVLYAGDKDWAKLCFEYSPQKIPFVVSVVNNGISDDCNHVAINGNTVYLRVSGLGNHVFAFHYSTDGKKWNLVRYFSLGTSKEIRTGFSSQSPTGHSCQSIFSEINYQPHFLKDIRNGE
jgi:uncharacterized protein